MMRELAVLAVVGLILMSEGASGFFGRRLFQRRCAPPPAVCYPPVVLAPPCLPVYEVVPTYSVVPLAPAVEVPAAPQPATPRVSIAPADPVRPAGELARPEATKPGPAKPVEPATPYPVPQLKSPEPRLESLTIPPTPVPGGRAAEVPKTNADKPAVPRLQGPAEGDGLPGLALPDAGTVARSSPIRARPAFELFPTAEFIAEGVVTRRVEFTNLSGRAATLTVEGKTANLPDRSTLAAEVPAEFRWSIDDGREVTSRVPGGAAGADVVLRR